MTPKISLMVFPQKQVGKSLFVNVLSVLRNYNPLTTSDINPAWADCTLRLQAKIIEGLDDYPRLDLANLPYDLPGITMPASAKNIFTSMQSRFNITKTANDATGAADMKDFQTMKKYLPVSYREAFNFTSPKNKDITVTGDEYHCAIKKNPAPDPNFGATISDETSWGRVFAFCLKHKELAKKCGFIHEQLEIKLNDDNFKNGGWLYIDIHPDCSYFSQVTADQNFVKRYAARIPQLDLQKKRDLFTAVAFPVLRNANLPGPDDPVAPSTLILDQMFTEAAMYDDGFCKILHNYQPVNSHLLVEEQDDQAPVTSDIGIRLAWDDEQIAEWLSRQMVEDAGTGKRADAPLGVFQYRIDVREKVEDGNPPNKWVSLCKVKYDQDVFLDEEQIGEKDDSLELGVEVYPSKPDQDPTTHYWLPAYFTQWIGKSLVLQDEDAIAIYHKDEIDKNHLGPGNSYDPANEKPFKASKNTFYKADGLENIALLYGHEYEFRGRMSDITGGGPTVENEPQYNAPSPITLCHFKRHAIPQEVNFITPLPVGDTEFFIGNKISLTRPRLGYPSVLFTGAYTDGVQKLIADGNQVIAENAKRDIGLADPDVDCIEIMVEVKCLALDATIRKMHAKDNFAWLYTTRRSFNTSMDSTLSLKLNFIDAPVLSFNVSNQLDNLGLNTSGNNDNDQRTDLVLPTARDLRITIRPITKTKEDYYGGIDEDGKNRVELKGMASIFMTRKESKSEKNFIKATGENMMIRGIYLQPEEPVQLTPDLNKVFIENLATPYQPTTLMDRLSNAIGAENKGMALLGKQGQRWQFGASRFIRNTTAPDNTSITFATKKDLLNHWLVPITLLISRDWSWNGLKPVGLSIYRRNIFLRDAMQLMGAIDREEFLENNSTKDILTHAQIVNNVDELLIGDMSFKQAINLQALLQADRSQTYTCFIDALEPRQTDPEKFPDEILAAYRVEVNFANASPTFKVDKELELYIHLPITAPPAEVPKIVSAGISMSSYIRDEEYANTETRRKYLWVEFAEPLKNTDDTFYARILAYAPDVLLAEWQWDLFIAMKEPALPIDPELIRIISPSSSDDRAGIFAMQEMIPAMDSKVHYILPIPPGMHSDALEMFGFFTYEFRVGHKIPWSTANGRFGRALRSTGIQHPPPQLYCVPNRNEKYITVSAPFAQTVFNGKNVTNNPPRTELWALLYAQVHMADDSDRRNILLSDKRLMPDKYKQEYAQSNADATPQGITGWRNTDVETLLKNMGLPSDSPLSVLCVEMLPGYEQFFMPEEKRTHYNNMQNRQANTETGDSIVLTNYQKGNNRLRGNFGNYMQFVNSGMKDIQQKIQEQHSNYFASTGHDTNLYVNDFPDDRRRPLTSDLGYQRILRTSTLVAVPAVCCTE